MSFLTRGLFNEYQCFDTLFRSRIQTKGGKVLKVYDIFSDEWYCEKLLNYVYSIVNGNNPFNKHLIAKFLTPPRLSKRSKHKRMLPETLEIMKHKTQFLVSLSKLMGWEYAVEGNYANFKGYRAWRKEYNNSLESVLFSTGKINEFSKFDFFNWFEKLPAQARFRVKSRILYSTLKKISDNPETPTVEEYKWDKFRPWIHEWERVKESKQAEQRVLEEKVRQNQATYEDLKKLEEVRKEAKVNVGAVSFKDIFKDIYNNGTSADELKMESFMNKVNLPYNSLVIIDDSGSMYGMPFKFATFLASVCMVKNPDDDARNLIGFFNSKSHWHSYIDKEDLSTPNWFMRAQVATVAAKPFVDPTKSFVDNYRRISSFANAVYEGGSTNIASIADGLYQECKRNSEVLDALKCYPIWTICSDGYFNQCSSPEASINDLMAKCQNYFGFKPYLVVIEIADEQQIKYWNSNIERFSGIENFMYIPGNPVQIEMFLTNFKDMDIMDVYAPLQSIFRSNRYELIREATL